ncbi:unnamed protein product, partial [Prorocentrum cordatum]
VLSNSCVAGSAGAAALADEKAAADRPEPRAAPDSLRPPDHTRPRPWCLEEAELPLEELDRLWTNRHFAGPHAGAEELEPRRASWLSSYGCCTATANRNPARHSMSGPRDLVFPVCFLSPLPVLSSTPPPLAPASASAALFSTSPGHPASGRRPRTEWPARGARAAPVRARCPSGATTVEA